MNVYVAPFSAILWIAIFCVSFLTGTCLYFIQEVFEAFQKDISDNRRICSKLNLLIQHIWLVWASNFGLNVASMNKNITKVFNSKKILLFVAFLNGNILFAGYRASLTSELSVKDISLPFTNIEEMIEANYM